MIIFFKQQQEMIRGSFVGYILLPACSFTVIRLVSFCLSDILSSFIHFFGPSEFNVTPARRFHEHGRFRRFSVIHDSPPN